MKKLPANQPATDTESQSKDFQSQETAVSNQEGTAPGNATDAKADTIENPPVHQSADQPEIVEAEIIGTEETAMLPRDIGGLPAIMPSPGSLPIRALLGDGTDAELESIRAEEARLIAHNAVVQSKVNAGLTREQAESAIQAQAHHDENVKPQAEKELAAHRASRIDATKRLGDHLLNQIS